MSEVILEGKQSVSLSDDSQSVYVLGDDCVVAHRGEQVTIKNTATNSTMGRGNNSVIMTSGDSTRVEYLGKATIFSAGAYSSFGVGGTDFIEGVTSEITLFASAESASTFVYPGVKKSLLVFAGDGAMVEDASDIGDEYLAVEERNTVIATGKESQINATAYPGGTFVSLGDDSMVTISGGYASEPDVRVKGGVAFVGGKNSTIQTGYDSAFYCAQIPEQIEFRPNSMAVIGWHDGTRERVSVFYEGENGVDANVKYTMNAQGQLVKI